VGSNVARLLLAGLGVFTTLLLGLAIWSSTGKPLTQRPPSTDNSAADPALATATAGNAALLKTSTAHGSGAGYDAAVQITQTGTGAGALTLLEVALTTEATPASAPTAGAQLIGSDRRARDVPLSLIGAGRWSSRQLAIPPGRYTLTTRFDRKGRPLTIPVTIRIF
jgi:hypothetical protein